MANPASSFCLFLVFGLNFLSSHTKPLDEWHNRIQTAEGNFDKEVEETSNREYDTVHGRILAVNMAHVRKKRQVPGNESQSGNVFEGIEKANEGNISEFYQGDIILDPELEDYIKTGGNSRNALRSRKRLWTSRIIPYRIPSWMSHVTSNVQKAVQEFHRNTCLRFVPYNSAYHKNYIEFGNSNGCSSRVGKRYAEAGRQVISLGDGCNFVGTVIHEMMHAIGFFHEQARIDRDNYVKIYWENILGGFSDQFDKYSWRVIDDLGVSYDYQSVMHYDRRAFTKNGKPTIVAVGNENMEFGTRDDLFSTRDVVEINALYDCRTQSYGWTSWSRWTPCDDDCYRTRERYCYHSGNIKSCGGNVNAYGVEKQSEKCPSSICPAPIDGHWGRWSEWRPCSKTCNDGTKTRIRMCDNPTPTHGGKPCPGSETEREMCILKRCNLDNDDADFENFRLGMWTNSHTDNLNWQFHKYFTKTMNTGPDRDHTSGKGYYLYMESSQTTSGQRAELVSPWMAAKQGGQCFKFYYSMYGQTIGSLAVKLDISNGKSWYIFYKSGNQDYGWKKGMGNIDLDQGLQYKLTILAKVGQTGYSDIAIDDVYIDPGLCSCQDEFYTCHLWAAKGECSANQVWMKKHCKRSCSACGATPAPPTIQCADSNPTQCPVWAASGECTKNPTWMRKNCQKSCKTCDQSTATPAPPTSCTDSDPTQCPVWASSGECAKNPSWMKKNCQKSCKICGGVSCQDSDESCAAWAKMGECQKNPGYMLPNCKLSCKQC